MFGAMAVFIPMGLAVVVIAVGSFLPFVPIVCPVGGFLPVVSVAAVGGIGVYGFTRVCFTVGCFIMGGVTVAFIGMGRLCMGLFFMDRR